MVVPKTQEIRKPIWSPEVKNNLHNYTCSLSFFIGLAFVLTVFQTIVTLLTLPYQESRGWHKMLLLFAVTPSPFVFLKLI